MRLVVTGAGGQLGRALVEHAEAVGHEVIAFDRAGLDIVSERVRDVLVDTLPDVVVNAAAFTDVDGAERDPETAFEVNEAAVVRLAEAARVAGARYITYSTDYVFDGTSVRPYLESDEPNPLQIYGRSKLAGERAALAAYSEGTWVVRTCWVYSAGGRTFVPTMLRLARTRTTLNVVADQVGSPTYAPDLAVATLALLAADVPPGIVHLAGGGLPASRLELAAAALAAAGLQVDLIPVSAAAFAAPAPRPAYSALGTAHVAAPRLPAWTDGVRRCADAFAALEPWTP